LQRGEMEVIALRKRSRFRYPLAIRLIRWIRGFTDAAYGVLARAGPPHQEHMEADPSGAQACVAPLRR
jgi:hypothetical protein